MPVPTPSKGEPKDEYISRCMHEVSKNPDRTNEQNVAICMRAWRQAHNIPEPKKGEEDAGEKFMSVAGKVASFIEKVAGFNPKGG